MSCFLCCDPTPTPTDLLNDSPRRTELAQDGFHCIADCADQHWRRERLPIKLSQTCAHAQASPHARVESEPFFSCRRSEDRPGPLSRRFTSSPIHDVSAFGTEPANEALRTADSRREGGITHKKYIKYQSPTRNIILHYYYYYSVICRGS